MVPEEYGDEGRRNVAPAILPLGNVLMQDHVALVIQLGRFVEVDGR